MVKMLFKVLFAVLVDQGAKADKKSVLRNLVVVAIIVSAIGVLQYSELMLNVHKIKVKSSIERPMELLGYRLESCQALLKNTEEDLKFCRVGKLSKTPSPFATKIP